MQSNYPITIVWDSPPNTICYVCRAEFVAPRTGRTRLTCSDACRQKRFRSRHRYLTETQKIERDFRRADRLLARIERRYGRLDETPRYATYGLRDFTWHYLVNDMPINVCRTCGKPVMNAFNSDLRQMHCSRKCKNSYLRRWRYLRRATRIKHWGRIYPASLDDISRYESILAACEHCGIAFSPNLRARKPAKYCSTACRQAAYYRRKHPAVRRRVPCAVCGQRFRQSRPSRIYCSVRCERTAWQTSHPTTPENAHEMNRCLVCLRPIKSRLLPGRVQMYCSHHCNTVARRMRQHERINRETPRRCLWCDKPIGAQVNLKRRYCDDRCVMRARSARISAERRARPPKPAVVRACEACGEMFEVFPRSGDRHRFCSRTCFLRVYRAAKRAIPLPVVFTPAVPTRREEIPLLAGRGGG